MTTLSTLRSAIISKIDSLTGFREVPFPVEYFGRAQNSIAHLGFSVTLTSSTATEERQRRVNVYMQTDIAVVFAYRLRPHDISTDIGSAHTKETEVIEAILGITPKTGYNLRYTRSQRRYPDSLEYIITELNLIAHHTP